MPSDSVTKVQSFGSDHEAALDSALADANADDAKAFLQSVQIDSLSVDNLKEVEKQTFKDSDTEPDFTLKWPKSVYTTIDSLISKKHQNVSIMMRKQLRVMIMNDTEMIKRIDAEIDELVNENLKRLSKERARLRKIGIVFADSMKQVIDLRLTCINASHRFKLSVTSNKERDTIEIRKLYK